MQLFEFGKMRQSKADLSRRDFVKKAGIAVCAVVTSSCWLMPEMAFAGSDLPSAVQAEDSKLKTAYSYIHFRTYQNRNEIMESEAISHLLDINPYSRGDSNFKIHRLVSIGITSPVYFILRSYRGHPLNRDEIETSSYRGNTYAPNLIHGINNLVPGKYMEARDYFAKNIFEIAKLNDNDYKQIEKTVGSSVDRGNFYKAFNSMSFEHRTWILNNVVWNKVKGMPLPANQYDPKDPGLALKNFYYSLGLLGVAENRIKPNILKSISYSQNGDSSGLYLSLSKKLKYHTYNDKIIWGPEK